MIKWPFDKKQPETVLPEENKQNNSLTPNPIFEEPKNAISSETNELREEQTIKNSTEETEITNSQHNDTEIIESEIKNPSKVWMEWNVQCPKCGTEYPYGTVRCEKCGISWTKYYCDEKKTVFGRQPICKLCKNLIHTTYDSKRREIPRDVFCHICGYQIIISKDYPFDSDRFERVIQEDTKKRIAQFTENENKIKLQLVNENQIEINRAEIENAISEKKKQNCIECNKIIHFPQTFCDNCSRPIYWYRTQEKEGDLFCEKCGSNVLWQNNSNCGKRPQSAFCENCGYQIAITINAPYMGEQWAMKRFEKISSQKSLQHNHQDSKSTVRKCPACGAIQQTMVSKCPECGYEFSDIKVVNSFDDFSTRLMRSQNYNFKTSIVENFPIPNAKEDITEFLILAKSELTVLPRILKS